MRLHTPITSTRELDARTDVGLELFEGFTYDSSVDKLRDWCNALTRRRGKVQHLRDSMASNSTAASCKAGWHLFDPRQQEGGSRTYKREV